MPNPSTQADPVPSQEGDDHFSACVRAFQEKVGAAKPRLIQKDHLTNQLHEDSVYEELHHVGLRLKGMAIGFKAAYAVTKDQRALRAELMVEELSELLSAMADRDEVDTADGLIDLLYVTFGTCTTFDIPAKPIFDEVHRSNMTKSSGAADHAGDRGKTSSFSRANLLPILNARPSLAEEST
jgi:phosphoribosyl-ATP pyrophosphohydrolase